MQELHARAAARSNGGRFGYCEASHAFTDGAREHPSRAPNARSATTWLVGAPELERQPKRRFGARGRLTPNPTPKRMESCGTDEQLRPAHASDFYRKRPGENGRTLPSRSLNLRVLGSIPRRLTTFLFQPLTGRIGGVYESAAQKNRSLAGRRQRFWPHCSTPPPRPDSPGHDPKVRRNHVSVRAGADSPTSADSVSNQPDAARRTSAGP